MTHALDTDRLVPSGEAASILGIREQTLGVWRLRGCGPAYIRVGRAVRYRLSDLATYIDSRRVSSTAEADALDA